MNRPTARDLIKRYQLGELPIEGGYFSQSYLSPESISKKCLPERYASDHPVSTAIYYLLTDEPDIFSALHWLKTVEVYHFYLGDPVEMLLLYPTGEHEIIHFGHDILNGQEVQYVVPQGVWQGSRLMDGGEFALLGTTMAPAYLDEDVVFGTFEELAMQYTEASDMIRKLTRM